MPEMASRTRHATRHLADLRAPQVAELIGPDSVLVQPLGAIEQHGPHLPFSTDYVIAGEVAEAVVQERGDELDLWLLPALAYTKSNEHAWSAGTVWLSATTLLAVLDDIGRSLATLPAKRVVFLNGHGGNSSLLNVALSRAPPEVRADDVPRASVRAARPGRQVRDRPGRRAGDGCARRHRRDLDDAAPATRARRHGRRASATCPKTSRRTGT